VTDQRRNVLILVAFSACLVIVSGAYVWRQLSPTAEADVAQVLAPTTDPKYLPPIEAPKLDAPYRQIADRNLFRPLPAAEAEAKKQEERQKEAERQRAAARAGGGGGAFEGTAWELPPPLAYGPAIGWAPPPATWGPATGLQPPQPPMRPAGEPGTSTMMPPERPAGPPATTVSVSGVVTGSDGRKRVLVSDNASGRSTWVEPGGRAFGYTVDYATERGSVLTKRDRTYVLGLGENKPVAKAPEKASSQGDSSAKPASPSPTEPKGGAQ